MDSSNPCAATNLEYGVSIDCKAKGISGLDPSWFPNDTIILNLDENDLSTLQNGIFSHLINLEELTISENKLSHLEPEAFTGLSNLLYLDIENNELDITNTSIPQDVFLPLQKLKVLKLSQKKDWAAYEYPDGFVFHLQQLEYLSINGVGRALYFDSRFCDLIYLTGLNIRDFDRPIDNSTFSKLTCLNITRLRIAKSVSPDFAEKALECVAHTPEEFRLHHMYIGVQQALKLFKSLQFRHLKEVAFSEVSEDIHGAAPSIRSRDGVISAETTKYLRNVCVESFSLLHSNVFVIETNAFQFGSFRKCLKHLDISGSLIYGDIGFLYNTLMAPNIESLTYVVDLSRRERLMEGHATIGSYNIHDLPPDLQSTQISNDRPTASHETSPNHVTKREISFPISKSIKSLYFDWLGLEPGNKMDFSLHPGANLRVAVLKNCGIKTVEKNLSGFETVQHLDLSGNPLRGIAVGFFDNLSSIESLILSSVEYFSSSLFPDQGSNLFKNLPSLKHIDLSRNGLHFIPQDLLGSNTILGEINLSHNKLSYIPFDVSLYEKLSKIDLRNNAFVSLSKEEMMIFDRRSSGRDMVLLFDGNVLSCACEQLTFLNWLQSTRVQLDNGGSYTCIGPRGSLTNTRNFSDVKGFWRLCYGKLFFWISLFLASCFVSGLLLVLLIQRYGTYLRAKIYQIFFPKCPRPKTAKDYAIDVFIGYADRDYKFPCHKLRRFLEHDLGLTVCIAHRDFMGSHDMATCIMEGIQNSWRTVLVVTEQFLSHDQWSAFTMNFSVYAQSLENPCRIVVVVEKRMRQRVPLQLLGAVRDENIISLPRMAMCYQLRQRLKFLLKVT